MDCRITARQVLPGIFHLSDRMGMHSTLIVGEREALLFDTGYGLDDLKKAVAEITPLPYQVILSHGHHDHACGSFQFDQVLLDEREFPVCEKYAGSFRKRVWDQATAKGLDLSDWREEDFLSRGYGHMKALGQDVFHLGHLTAQVIRMPAHTPGSIGLYIPERQLLLSGDNFNPTTWLFFPEAQPMADFLSAMEKMLALPFRQVLCSHGDAPLDRARMEDFYRGITMENIAAHALPQPGLGFGARVYGFAPAEGMWFCFDGDKLPPAWREALMKNHPFPG